MEILATISVILGIIVSCITIYQAFVKKTPGDSSQSQPTFRQQYPQSYSQQYPSPQVYSPSQRQVKTFSWGGCMGTTVGVAVSLFLFFEVLLILQGRSPITLGNILLGSLITAPLSLSVGIIAGFRRGRR